MSRNTMIKQQQQHHSQQQRTIALGLVGLIVVVVIATVIAMMGQAQPQGGDQNVGAPSSPGERRFGAQVIPAEILPDRAPDLEAGLIERRDNTLIVQRGEPGTRPMEVVVTPDTLVYVDNSVTTLENMLAGRALQQSVREGDLSEFRVTPSGTPGVTVWGTRSGDRFIAEVVVFIPPMVFSD